MVPLRSPTVASILLGSLLLLPWAGAAEQDVPQTRPSSDRSGAALEFHRTLEESPFRAGTSPGEEAVGRSQLGPIPSARRVVIALLAVLGLIVVGGWLLRRTLPAVRRFRGRQIVEVLSRQQLAPKQQLCLIRLHKRLLLVAATGASVNTIAEIKDPEEVAAVMAQVRSARPGSRDAGFEQWFKRFAGQHDDAEPAEPEGAGPADQARGQLRRLTDRLHSLTHSSGSG